MSAAVSNNGSLPQNFSKNMNGNDKDSHLMDTTDEDQIINYSSNGNSKQCGIQKVADLLKGKLNKTTDSDSSHCDDQVTDCVDNDNNEKYLNGSFTYSAENSMNGDSNHLEKGVHDLSAMVSRHMIQNRASPSGNNTKVLRGILQNQVEGRMDESYSDNVEHQEAGYMRSASYEIDVDGDDSFQSHSPLDMSSEEESDQENNPNRANSPSAGVNTIGIYDHSKLMSRYPPMDISRHRIGESSSPNSPSKKDSPTHTPLDTRRPKRKQYVPQQHGNIDIDADNFDSPRPKCLKTGDNIGAQIMDLQNQLRDLERKVVVGRPSGRESPFHFADDLKIRGKYDGDKSLRGELETFASNAARCIEEASQKCMQNGKSLEKDKFANMLKVEITDSVNKIVDGIVAKYFNYKEQKEQLKEKNTTTMPSPKEGPGVPPLEPVEPAETGKNKIEETAIPSYNHANNNNNEVKPSFVPSSPPHRVKEPKMPQFHHKPSKTKVTDKIVNPFFDVHPHKNFAEMLKMQSFYPPNPFLPMHGPMMHHHHPHLYPDIRNMFAKDLMKPEPEQTEPISLVVNTPKKKRTKVTDTRLSPRAARALLHEPVPVQQPVSMENHSAVEHLAPHHHLPHHPHHHPHLTLPHTPQEAFSHSPFLPVSLPTSVAIPNPSLQQSEFMSMYHGEHSPFAEVKTSSSLSPVRDHISPNMSHGGDPFYRFKPESEFDSQDTHDGYPLTATLTPMHLRKAKLMFFFLRYPSSSILKIYFPDVKFNKNNTAQLVKWFSNFREFYYIQMEKYARQALAEGVTNPEDLIVTTDAELYRVLNLHYNRNNQLEVPAHFRVVVQATLREFFKAVTAKKDTEQSWKKSIYKVIARLDDSVPDFFKSPNWMEQLNDS